MDDMRKELEAAINKHITSLELLRAKHQSHHRFQSFDLKELTLHADSIGRLVREIDHITTGRPNVR